MMVSVMMRVGSEELMVVMIMRLKSLFGMEIIVFMKWLSMVLN